MVGVDVLIVGAGPTGLALALELAVQKVSFRIINKSAERSPYSRAIVVQPRTQEILSRHGNAQRLLAKGLTARGTTIAVNGKRVTELVTDFVGITSTRFLAPKTISQAETEKHLDRLLAEEHGVAAEMGVEAKTVTPDADGVTVVLLDSKTGKEEALRVKYVVGADGAHSVVRHAAKSITFDGDAYPQEFMLADVHFKSDQPPDMAYFCLGTGICVILPMQDRRARLILSRPEQPGEHELSLDDFRNFLKTVFPGTFEISDPPVWMTSFHLHHRLASSYREGRLLLAGDAAHIHSPAGGQGMNTGIQDAANLGWKLAAVLRGERPETFLDTYEEERRPVGQYLLRNSDRLFSFMTTRNRFLLWLRNAIVPWVMPWVTSSPARVLNSVKFMTQFGVKYRRSSIVGTAAGFDGPVRGGFRAPEGVLKGPEGGRDVYLQDLCEPDSHHLILFSGAESGVAGEGDLQRAEAKFLDVSNTKTKVHTIFSGDYKGQAGWVDVGSETHKAYGFLETSGYVLVRPDGYVADIGPLSAFDDLIVWMQQ